jgi:hypothetical protein
MNRSKLFFPAAIALLVLFSLTTAFAQDTPKPVPPIEPSYDVMVHIVIGSNDTAGAALPSDLAGISRELKSNFSFSNYRLADTFLGRLANRGDLEYKSVFNLQTGIETESQSFMDWSLHGFKSGKDANDRAMFQADLFRFGGRVPVRLMGDAKTGPAVVYESIGLNLQRLTLPPNTPTLIGTITMTKALGTMFVVITVKSAT